MSVMRLLPLATDVVVHRACHDSSVPERADHEDKDARADGLERFHASTDCSHQMNS